QRCERASPKFFGSTPSIPHHPRPPNMHARSLRLKWSVSAQVLRRAQTLSEQGTGSPPVSRTTQHGSQQDQSRSVDGEAQDHEFLDRARSDEPSLAKACWTSPA